MVIEWLLSYTPEKQKILLVFELLNTFHLNLSPFVL